MKKRPADVVMALLEGSAWFLLLDPLIFLLIFLPAFFAFRQDISTGWIVAASFLLWLLARRLVQKALDRWK